MIVTTPSLAIDAQRHQEDTWAAIKVTNPPRIQDNIVCMPEVDFDSEALKVFPKMLDDAREFGQIFAAFADTFVPYLATLSLERPDIMALDFDIHLDQGKFKATGDDIARKELVWIEDRLNEHPRLAALAGTFNQRVVKAYGDEDGPFYQTFKFDGAGLIGGMSIPNLAETVDRDVAFMALLRKVQDADLTRYAYVDESRRYEAGSVEVLDMLVRPDTYGVTSTGKLVLDHQKPPPSGEWVA